MGYTSGNLTELLKMPIEIVDLPIEHGGSFHRFLSTFTRGYTSMQIPVVDGILLMCILATQTVNMDSPIDLDIVVIVLAFVGKVCLID